MIPILIGRHVERLQMWHRTNADEAERIREGPVELFELWDEESIAWAADVYDSPGFAKLRERQVEINTLVETESDVSKRSTLLDEERKLWESDF